jgi:hypothetical protein
MAGVAVVVPAGGVVLRRGEDLGQVHGAGADL